MRKYAGRSDRRKCHRKSVKKREAVSRKVKYSVRNKMAGDSAPTSAPVYQDRSQRGGVRVEQSPAYVSIFNILSFPKVITENI